MVIHSSDKFIVIFKDLNMKKLILVHCVIIIFFNFYYGIIRRVSINEIKRTLILIMISFVLLIFNSCKKSSNTTPESDDQLSDSQIQSIEAAGIDTVSTFSDALFPNGININQWDLYNDSGYIYTFDRPI